MNLRWYEDFFQGVAVEMWRKAVPEEQTRLEADYLQRALKLRPGARVLDVPCGSGRHSLELASRGFKMTGVDISSEQIEEAVRQAGARKLGVDWKRSEMRDLAWEAEFDAAFCMGNSFGYLDPAGNGEFLKAVSRSLKPGGRFVMDYGMAAESILPSLRDREWMKIEDILFLEENRYHPLESCVETTYTFVRGGKADVRTGLQWVYTVRELRALLDRAGLPAEELHTSLEGEPFRLGSRYLLVTAARR